MNRTHHQHRNVEMNSQRGLLIGGVLIPYSPSYWSGTGGGDGKHGQTTNEGPNNDNSGSADTGSGADSSGQM